MLPVYICEDDPAIRAFQEDYLKKQILIGEYDMKLVLSSAHPQDILKAVAEAPGRGIYFLDVELKNEPMDGFTLGQEIRKLDARGFIVYVTAFRDLAFETFRYHLEALDYIVKENEQKVQEGIRHSLQVITERMKREVGEQREFFTVKVLDVVRHIPVDEIMFFATAGTHRIELYGEKDRIDFIGSMQELEKQLGSRFLRVHRAYLVNVEQIEELDLKNREIRMNNGETCLFSRSVKGALLSRI
ncbi:response regulator transcription factor [Schaedlerella arabinosiphila]|uniref:Stage 0 sporulation protein A homolog n=1 Tax=Schaedlerella arabinosiphila TaxID=2044587 RepID=A0A9X5C8F9_9FIRM|nr:LytTR family DNA-binding domain-containing protein [Schaedlerella arabinosiphila]KAI4440512.1 Accessory gene regulator protein A [Schaedlerella arabinosiphila]NDO69620.1 response regulator transcription factor [Schaedlerella arabinosiphila]